MEADGIISSMAVLIVVLMIWAVIQQRAAMRANTLLDRQRADVLAIIEDRDGWREISRRLTLIAESSQDTTERAAIAVEKVVGIS